jgi:hypothetical protein
MIYQSRVVVRCEFDPFHPLDRIASQRFPPDSFPLEDWNSSYLQLIGCADEVPIWEKLSLDSEETSDSIFP